MDILEVESLFQRYLANPMRDWTGEIPYVIRATEDEAIKGIEGLGNINNTQSDIKPKIEIVVDIEDVRYENISFTMKAAHYSMFLRASTEIIGTQNEPDFDRRLKQVTNDIERFIRSDDMLVYQEIFARRLRPNILESEWPLSGMSLRDRGLAFIEPVPIPESTRDKDLEKYPGIYDDEQTLDDINIHPYHPYEIDEYGSDVIIQDKYERVYGYRYNLDRLRFRGSLPNGVEQDYLLSDDTIDNEDVEPINTNIPANYTQINIRPKELISFELQNTFFTFIDRDDVDRELRNETLVRVSVYE